MTQPAIGLVPGSGGTGGGGGGVRIGRGGFETARPVVVPRTVIKAGRKWYHVDFRELWQTRDLLYFLSWRDIKVRYKQTIFGAGWAVIQPTITMIVFTLFFGRLVGLEQRTDGVPYSVFVFAGLIPWNLFSGIYGKASNCVVSNQHLVTKIYFPRLALPLSSIGANLIDFSISSIVLLVLMAFHGLFPGPMVLLTPLALGLIILTALGVSMMLAAMTAFFRDFVFLSNYLLQIWMYLTPVIYPLDILPERWKWLIGLNPLAGAIETFRYLLLGHAALWNPMILVISTVSGIVLFVAGLLHYNRCAPRFSDCV